MMSPRFRNAASKAGAPTAKAVSDNPLDQAWTDRPPQPLQPGCTRTHLNMPAKALKTSGAEQLPRALNADQADAAVITAPASIAWLFNIRGGDVACSPLPLARAIVRQDGSATLYMDPAKETEGLREHLGNQVTLSPLTDLDDDLASLAERADCQSGPEPRFGLVLPDA